MHQTFYIDADEEISSVIDRLSKSMSSDNYFVVPKRALFLQSIVNLKILKREADKLRKRVILVTQDDIGSSMAQRSEIEVRDSLEGIEPTSDVFAGEEQFEQADEDEYVEPSLHSTKISHSDDEKRIRLSGVGSSDFFAAQEAAEFPVSSKQVVRKTPKAAADQSAALSASSKNKKISQVTNLRVKNVNPRIAARIESPKKPQAINGVKNFQQQALDPTKEKSLERMFAEHKKNEMQQESKSVGGPKTKKVFLMFIALCALAFVGAIGYLFFPSAKIVVSPSTAIKRVDVDIKGGQEVQVAEGVIPVRFVNQQEEFSANYEISGEGAAISGKKAQGSVTIYNEYSNEPQTLVATTRIKSEDGKIFHLLKNVIVPGFTKSGDEIKAGAAKVDVVADQPGDEYNLEATKFTIPGFEGGPKFEKFYAESSQEFSGGTKDQQQAVAGIVTQGDLDTAKQKAQAAFKEKVSADIASKLQEGEIALPQAQNVTITKSTTAARVGMKTDDINYLIQGNFQVAIFSENTVKDILLKNVQNDPQSKNAKISISKIEYGTVDTDFDAETFAVKVHGEISVVSEIDTKALQKELLGKNDSELSGIMRKYPAIKSANVEFNPSFVTRIPQYAQRVSVEVRNDAQQSQERN